ncbi:PDDEXK-like family protein [Inhella crocodyli]|nr:PD-(D/E)XK nuclease family protein [Inhella crocodyli]
MDKQLLDFFSDPTLVDLLEQVKSSNDILTLLTPRENQHSDLLAWCLNAREGHGQGDGLLKDFLLAVFKQSTQVEPGDKLYGRGLTRDFVRAWKPARIVTSSFAGAICLREYSLPKSGDGVGGRLDLLVVDPDNRILVVIENKAGARFRPGQLEGYLEAVQKSLLSRAAFKDFHVAFVAMDRNWDTSEEDEGDSNGDDLDGRWAKLDYSWLRAGAQRAEVAVRRGNQAAALLLSYCRAQTGFESEEESQISRKAQDLAVRYPGVVNEIKRVARELNRPEVWTPGLLSPENTDGQLLRLYLQHEEALNRLIELPPLHLLHAKLAEQFPALERKGEYELGRVKSAYCLPLEFDIPLADDFWPLFVRVRHLNVDATVGAKFRVRYEWHPSRVPDIRKAEICALVAKAFPAAANSEGRGRVLVLMDEMVEGVDAAVRCLKGLLERTEAGFRS